MLDIEGLVKLTVNTVQEEQRGRKMPTWSRREDEFLRVNLGRMTDAEMGEALGRTETAVHLRWSRDLGLPGPSKAPGILTAQGAALKLGVDVHHVTNWLEKGLLKGRRMAGPRGTWLIEEGVFKLFVISVGNWIRFDRERVVDEELRRLLRWRAERWGDEWLTTDEVAVEVGLADGRSVTAALGRGLMQGVQVWDRCGRSGGGWALWFVRRSWLEVYRPSRRRMYGDSVGQVRFYLVGRAIGLPNGLMARLMKGSGRAAVELIWRRVREGWDLGKMARLDGLVVVDGEVWQHWGVFAGRFPWLAGAMWKFEKGEELSRKEIDLVRGVVYHWVKCFGERRDLAWLWTGKGLDVEELRRVYWEAARGMIRVVSGGGESREGRGESGGEGILQDGIGDLVIR